MYDRWYMWTCLHGNQFLSWYLWIQNKCFINDSYILINVNCNHVSFYSWIFFSNFTVCVCRKQMWRVSLKIIYIWTIFTVQNTTEIDQRSPSPVTNILYIESDQNIKNKKVNDIYRLSTVLHSYNFYKWYNN